MKTVKKKLDIVAATVSVKIDGGDQIQFRSLFNISVFYTKPHELRETCVKKRRYGL